ncbi:MAG: type VI secretion system protein ImpA [Planctomycetota bacterium]|jgi:type VI secretion system protein ImpA
MLDIDSLVVPISDSAPAGEDLRLLLSDTTFQTISNARTEIPVEDDPGGEGRSADWSLAIRESIEVLTSKTKDLEIAAWLTESLCQTEGFAGLNQGLELVRRLAQDFWQHIHPGVDEDDGEITLPIRARPLTWMGTSKDFIRSASSCAIVRSPDGRVLSWYDYKNTELVDQKKALSDQTSYNEMIEAGYISGDDWTSRVNSMDPSALGQVLADVKDCESSLGELRSACDTLFEEDEPNFVALAELLLEVREYLESRAPAAAPAGEVAQGAVVAGGVAAAPVGAATGPGASAGPIAGRDDALRRLTEVAEYFRRTEPHSPISHLVARTVRWGHMPLPDLLQEIVKDDDVLSRIWDTLGIQGRDGDDDNSNDDD